MGIIIIIKIIITVIIIDKIIAILRAKPPWLKLKINNYIFPIWAETFNIYYVYFLYIFIYIYVRSKNVHLARSTKSAPDTSFNSFLLRMQLKPLSWIQWSKDLQVKVCWSRQRREHFSSVMLVIRGLSLPNTGQSMKIDILLHVQ